MEASRSGDCDAFTLLRQRYQKRTQALLWRLTAHREVCRDLDQDTWTQAYAMRGSFAGRSRVSTWLYAIALNLARNWKRNQKQVLSLDSPQKPDVESTRTWAEALQDRQASP